MPDASSVEMAKDVWAQREFWSVRILGCVTEQTFWIFGCLCSTCISGCVSLSCSKMLPRRHGQGRDMGDAALGISGPRVPHPASIWYCTKEPFWTKNQKSNLTKQPKITYTTRWCLGLWFRKKPKQGEYVLHILWVCASAKENQLWTVRIIDSVRHPQKTQNIKNSTYC